MSSPDAALTTGGAGQALYERAKRLIPGGTQLLSKRPEMFLPDQWPSYYREAKGIAVRDLDGNAYRDFTHCGVGTCILGFADDDVNAAVARAIQNGSMATLNCPEEIELAELLVELHPWAENVRYARSGGEAMAVAVRIARAATGRSTIAVCGYHGWSDWYIAVNLGDPGGLDDLMLPGLDPAGVPAALSASTRPFHPGDVDGLDSIISDADGQLAAIVIEPCRSAPPPEGFLEAVRQRADHAGAVLIFDEVTSGWRMNVGGIHMTLGVTPDIAVFAKGISNGYPMAAIVGTRAAMDAAQQSFISSTYWTERIGPVAAIATINKMRQEHVPDRLIEIGNALTKGWRNAAEAAALPITTEGIPPLKGFTFEVPDRDAAATLYTQEMLARGFLAASHVYATFAHGDSDISDYLDAAADVFQEIADAIRNGEVRERLRGPVRHNGFFRLT